MLKSETKENIVKWKMAIVTFLIVLLMAIFFTLGAAFSCDGEGYLKNFKCVNPTRVATVNVCEYNPMNCVSKCKGFLVDDIDAFCKQYAISQEIPTAYG